MSLTTCEFELECFSKGRSRLVVGIEDMKRETILKALAQWEQDNE
jgi:hypothetical protein